MKAGILRFIIVFMIFFTITPTMIFGETTEEKSWYSGIADFFGGVGDTIGEWWDGIEKQKEEEEKKQKEFIQQIIMIVGIIVVAILALYFGSKMFKAYNRRKKEEEQEKRAEERAERQQRTMAQLYQSVNSDNINAPKF